MAVKQKKSQSPKGNELLESPEALAERLTKSEEFLEKNKKLVFGIGGLLALLIAGYFGYRTYMASQNEQAHNDMFQAVYYFEGEEYDKALDGDGNYPGFLEIIDEYGMTDAANLAHYYVGSIYLQQGQFQDAIEHLGDFSADDLLVQSHAYSLTGDAHMELEQYGQAADAYDKAANHKENQYFSPMYLSKAAMAFELNGDNSQALDRYTQITEKYYGANEYENARKQKARLEAMASN